MSGPYAEEEKVYAEEEKVHYAEEEEYYPPPLTTHAPTPTVNAFQTACIDTGTNTFRVCA